MITIEQVIEQCAQAAEVAQGLNGSRNGQVLAAIRALKAQYEGCIVADGEVERYKPVAHSHGTDLATRWEHIPLYRAREAK